MTGDEIVSVEMYNVLSILHIKFALFSGEVFQCLPSIIRNIFKMKG